MFKKLTLLIMLVSLFTGCIFTDDSGTDTTTLTVGLDLNGDTSFDTEEVVFVVTVRGGYPDSAAEVLASGSFTISGETGSASAIDPGTTSAVDFEQGDQVDIHLIIDMDGNGYPSSGDYSLSSPYPCTIDASADMQTITLIDNTTSGGNVDIEPYNAQ